MKSTILRSLCFLFLALSVFSINLKAADRGENVLTTLAEMQYSNIPPSMFDYFATFSAETIVDELAKKGFTFPIFNPQNPDFIATMAGLFKAALKVDPDPGTEETVIKGLTNLAKIAKTYKMKDWAEALAWKANKIKNG